MEMPSTTIVMENVPAWLVNVDILSVFYTNLESHSLLFKIESAFWLDNGADES